MKVGQRSAAKAAKATNPNKNYSKKNLIVVAILAVTVLMIIWVYSMGRKAEETVSVIMYAEPVYKNEVITESMLKEYQMLKGEYEKYTVTDENGTPQRRILLWEERGNIINMFAAYPLQQDTVAMYTDVISSRIDNSDSVLYSYPGKNIISLEVGNSELQAFKTFLEPGDRINITALYKVSEEVYKEDEMGNTVKETVETFKEETVFKDIVVADLLNSSGQSILDIYASYKEKTVYQQAALDSSESFKSSVEPSTMLVALTPEEELMYYTYLNKNEVEFRVSLPQRVE